MHLDLRKVVESRGESTAFLCVCHCKCQLMTLMLQDENLRINHREIRSAESRPTFYIDNKLNISRNVGNSNPSLSFSNVQPITSDFRRAWVDRMNFLKFAVGFTPYSKYKVDRKRHSFHNLIKYIVCSKSNSFPSVRI